MRSDEQAFYGYHAWQVFFQSNSGLVHLPEGYTQDAEVLAKTWIQGNPDVLISVIQTE